MKSLQAAQPQQDSSDKVSDKTIVIPNKHTAIADSFKGQHSWYTLQNNIFFYGLDS